MIRKNASPDSLVAALLLAFLATAGLFYVNIMPALVDGLIEGLHFSQKQAGFVASANVYGAALGALVAVFFVKRIRWRPVAIGLLCVLIALDLLSTTIISADALIAARALQGMIGGMLVGTAFSVIARTAIPERAFGMLLFVQFGLGGVGLMVLPRLVTVFGTPVLFVALALFSATTLAMIPFLSDYPPRPVALRPQDTAVRWAPLVLVFASIVLFQAGNMALAAYMIELGRAHGLGLDFISATLGVSGWVGALGSLVVVFAETRFGRFLPLLIALVLTVAGNALFHLSASALVYAGANIGTAITWAFVVPYLLGMCAAFDPTGRIAALGGFFSKLGLATGPLAAGLLLDGTRFGLLINISVIALALSGIAATIPAVLLDRTSRARAASQSAI
jgi:predicted MFS family arabinose efflux permease